MEYRIKTWIKIFLWILAIALCIAALFVFSGPSSDKGRVWLIIFLSLAAIATFIGVISASKFVLIINADEIHVYGLFTVRSISTKDIRGYRTIEGKNPQLKFIPFEKSVKPIRISIDNLSKSKELVDYVKAHFSNIDEIEFKEELDALLRDENLGLTVEDRNKFLKLRKNIATGLNIIGGVTAIAIFFVPSSFEFLNVLPLSFPILALLLVCTSKGVVRLIGRPKAVRPAVGIAFVLPPLFFLLKEISAYRIYDLSPFWSQWMKWSVVIFIFFIVLLFSAAKEVREKGSVFLLLGIAFVCAAGILIFSNCYFDKSQPEIFEVKVLNKWKQSGKSTTYYLSLDAWGKYAQADRETVSRNFYNAINIGDSISVNVHQGKWHIPWYTLHVDTSAEIKNK